MENFVLPRMPLCGSVLMLIMAEYTEDFTDSMKGNGCLGKPAIDRQDSSMM